MQPQLFVLRCVFGFEKFVPTVNGFSIRATYFPRQRGRSGSDGLNAVDAPSLLLEAFAVPAANDVKYVLSPKCLWGTWTTELRLIDGDTDAIGSPVAMHNGIAVALQLISFPEELTQLIAGSAIRQHRAVAAFGVLSEHGQAVLNQSVDRLSLKNDPSCVDAANELRYSAPQCGL